jgi:plastocyanin
MKTLFASIALLTLLSACAHSPDPPGTAAPTHSTPIDYATVGSISGTITFTGSVPPPQKIDMSKDPACGTQPNLAETLVVNNGDLANVFVYVKQGADNLIFDQELRPLEIHQRGCRYVPHVAGAMVGQTIKFVNDDNTFHNIHPHPATNPQWNESQMPNSPPIEKRFDRPEVLIPIQCNQHPWMHMYLGVVSNPFFAVTDQNGKFQIRGLPPGTYTLAAVHERLGEQDVKITIGPKESKTANFNFIAPQSGSANLGW